MNLKKRISGKKEGRFHYEDVLFSQNMRQGLAELLPFYTKEIVVVCIGTDRSTGDSLGPLTGTLLNEKANKRLSVYGTLSDPIHAVNLEEKMEMIEERHPKAFIIAIDACLGRTDSIGSIILSPGPLKPGAALKKPLPDVGDIHLTGVVNISGYMEFLVLQNTRLNIVMQMARKITDSLHLLDLELAKKQAVPLRVK
ncbi:spore protease YyaC [Sediminibacillus halophilus]|uniref:Putative sporulation protein YyaC n=1 Tax=Sediminibacillus halophilus TaxID=482461 RepID=A0A1G9SZV6_9BACI|nr:spore protease YyaC [Sediminibacillus halophilus]SDM40969.1 putative sporulation protein YyaC [Sediminibacillus halophilus]